MKIEGDTVNSPHDTIIGIEVGLQIVNFQYDVVLHKKDLLHLEPVFALRIEGIAEPVAQEVHAKEE